MTRCEGWTDNSLKPKAFITSSNSFFFFLFLHISSFCCNQFLTLTLSLVLGFGLHSNSTSIKIFHYRCHNHPHGERCTVGEDRPGITQNVLLGEPKFIIVLLRRFIRNGGRMTKNNNSVALGSEIQLNGCEYYPIGGSAHIGQNLQSGKKRHD